MPTIALLPGDGIGPEVAAAAVEVLNAVADDLSYDEHPAGGAAIDLHGTALTDEAMEACKASDAVLLGALGGPKWDTNEPGAVRPEQGLFRLRAELGLFANLRPVRPLPALYDASPLKRELIENVDMLVVRELTGGLYYGERGTSDGRAYDTMVYTVPEIERITREAFRAAKSRVTSVDKANVLDTSRLWRSVVTRIHDEEFPDIELEHLLVDAAAMKLVAAPRHFEVIVTENMFGDILSDEASMLTGSLGMLPSASLGGERSGDEPAGRGRGPGLFEPVHGTAPDIAGQGIANPIGMILSAALMLRHGLGREEQAAAVESAVDKALEKGVRPLDLGGNATTAEVTRAVLEEL
ncbi:MAG TPA: 3-isopropylmalate dehydrogenase [Solirubrobacter sp.]|nr:3-isopropylmalate dehydrogenase [Solirubrobacter sp.]